MPTNQLFTDWVATNVITATKLNQMKNDLAALASADFTVLTVGANTVWHAGNDGSGSGLDADLLDGDQLSTILTSTALSGTPTAPTAAAGTNTTQIATTAFVQRDANNNKGRAMRASYVITAATSATEETATVQYDTEAFDGNSMVDIGGFPARVTLAAAGVYRVVFFAAQVAVSTVNNDPGWKVALRKNAATITQNTDTSVWALKGEDPTTPTDPALAGGVILPGNTIGEYATSGTSLTNYGVMVEAIGEFAASDFFDVLATIRCANNLTSSTDTLTFTNVSLTVYRLG
jgi:hypothetical protein